MQPAAGWTRMPILEFAMPTMTSRRLMASRGLLAWIVVSEPSWPVFMACNMSSASSPRTSPTMMRSGRIRRALITKLPLLDRALAFDVGRPRFQARDVLLPQLQFGRVFDGDDALVFRNELGEHVEQRGLAGAGTARNDDVQARLHAGLQQLEHALGHASDFAADLSAFRRSRPKRRIESSGPSTATRRNHGVHARAVGQARVHHRRRFVHAPADADTICSMIRSRCALSLNSTGVRSSLPSRSI